MHAGPLGFYSQIDDGLGAAQWIEMGLKGWWLNKLSKDCKASVEQ